MRVSRHHIIALLFLLVCVPHPAFAVEDTDRGKDKGKDAPVIAANRPPVAVMPFDRSESFGGVFWSINVGKSLGAMMTTELKTLGFRVVNRKRMGDLLKEQDFGESGRVNRKTAPAVGKIIGAPYMIMGTVSEFGMQSKGGGMGGILSGVGLGVKQNTARVKIDIELVNVETSETEEAIAGTGNESNLSVSLTVDWYKNVNFQQDEWWNSQLGKAARKACVDAAKKLVAKYNKLPEWTKDFDDGGADLVTAKIVSADSPDAIVIDLGSKDGVKAGDTFDILHEDQVVKNDKGEVVFRKTSKIGEAEVTEVQDHGAMLKMTQNSAGGPKVGDLAKQLPAKKK
jgi:curli biogenesis system outer membrane secretion channel CsgG